MRKFWTKLIPNKETFINLIGFICLVFCYAIIPYILFCEAYGSATHTGTKISLGFCLGIVLIAIVVKKMWLNTQSTALRTRIGIMSDNLKTETDEVKKEKIAYRIAAKNILVVAINLIVPVLCIVAVVLVASTIDKSLTTAHETLVKLIRTIQFASISFAVGVVVQIILPFIRARLCYRVDKGV